LNISLKDAEMAPETRIKMIAKIRPKKIIIHLMQKKSILAKK